MEYLSTEWLKNWTNTHCKSRDALVNERNEAILEASVALAMLDTMEITTDPITFDSRGFKTVKAFSTALFMASEEYKDSDDIIVRYTKPKNKDTNTVSIQFNVLKSKTKIFRKYMYESNDTLEFCLDSANDIKSCVKFFNSLGVKGVGRESLTSKETDYSKDMRDALKKGENKIYVTIGKFVDLDDFTYILLEWNLVSADYNADKYEDIKLKVESILRV